MHNSQKCWHLMYCQIQGRASTVKFLTPCLSKGIGKNNRFFYQRVRLCCPKQPVFGTKVKISNQSFFLINSSQKSSFVPPIWSKSWSLPVSRFYLCPTKSNKQDQKIHIFSKAVLPLSAKFQQKRPETPIFHQSGSTFVHQIYGKLPVLGHFCSIRYNYDTT